MNRIPWIREWENEAEKKRIIDWRSSGCCYGKWKKKYIVLFVCAAAATDCHSVRVRQKFDWVVCEENLHGRIKCGEQNRE